MLDRVTIESGRLKAKIKVFGAELSSLYDKQETTNTSGRAIPKSGRAKPRGCFPSLEN